MKRIVVIAVLVSIMFLTLPGFAATHTVNCNLPGPAGKIATYLKFLNPLGPNTLNVRGTCKENITINQFGRLSLIAVSGATIQDTSGGKQPVISITDSQGIYLQGFTIVGGSQGVTCFDGSVCRFSVNTIENSVGAGVWVSFSQATFSSDTIQDTGDPGLAAEASRVSAGGLTVQRSSGAGIYDANGSVVYAFVTSILSNRGDGILVVSDSHMFLGDSTVSDNAFNGIDVNDQSEVLLLNNTVTTNGYNGVGISDQSLAELGGTGTFTGNGLDIACLGQFSEAKGTQGTIYGTTNCAVSAAQAGAAKPNFSRPRSMRALVK